MKAMLALAAAAAWSAILAGCGGDSPRYSLGSTVSCLKAAGVSVTYHLDDSDYVVFPPFARAARGGALQATIGATTVLVVFERSEDDAKRTVVAAEDEAGMAARDQVVAIDDAVHPQDCGRRLAWRADG